MIIGFQSIHGKSGIRLRNLSLILSMVGFAGCFESCPQMGACLGPVARRLLGEAGVTNEIIMDNDSPDGWVNLSVAIAALRRDLAAAWFDGRNKQIRFKVEPVELTVQAGVTRTGKGQAGVKWHILTLGGEKSRENSATQTLKLKLMPVFYDEHGELVPDQLVSGEDIFADELPDRS